MLFLEDSWNDPIKAELQGDFLELGRQVGRDALMIRGFDPDEFYASAYETLTLYDKEWRDRIMRRTIMVLPLSRWPAPTGARPWWTSC